MALSAQSLFLYGYTVDITNPNLDFMAASGGPVLTAVLDQGPYSLTSLLSQIVTAMNTADMNHTYAAVADRTLMGGIQNRVTIQQLASTANFLSLLFGSGPNSSTSVATLIGFNKADYTGATSYTGALSTGQTLIPEFIGYNYRDNMNQAKLFGAVNVSAAGIKETVTFNTQLFIDVDYKYEPKSRLIQWVNLFSWLINQKPFDFTPEITNPTYYFPVTLEKTNYEGKGLGFQMSEMIPSFPNLYQTGPLNFRVVLNYQVQTFQLGGG